jgi:hypothetical protein
MYCFVSKSFEIKEIIDCETILNVMIFYMSDNTSYSENQILMISDTKEKLIDNLFKIYLKFETDRLSKIKEIPIPLFN